MAYSAQKLISKSWYLSGIVSRGLQTVSGDQISDGLDLLNFIIASKAYDKDFIPYFSEYSLTAVIGQEKYFIPNLVEIESFTFNMGNVRFPVSQSERKNYFATARVDNINSLPFKWHAERTLDGTNLYLYFSPMQAFPLKIWGKFAFDDVTLGTDLLLVYDEYYINYLLHELAAYMCNYYGIPLNPQVASTLEAIRVKIRYQSPIDLTVTKQTRFGTTYGDLFGYANLGRGWTVPY